MNRHRDHGGRRRFSVRAQALIELTIALFLCVIMIYGIFRLFDWSQREFTGRLKAHENVLLQDCGRDGYCPMEQTRSKFFEYAPVNAQVF